MTKFSVKKPLTVLVAVVAVIVLGIVSYTRMTPDLLPNIDLPYVLVMTTYPGATPEKVEQEITKPLERTMATLEDIKSISSTSGSNYSSIVLEFVEDADLDSITVDMLQKIDAIEGSWDDAIGTPNILKINPNMLPVMVAAVSMDGMDTVALSDFTQETLLPALEGTSGVASISASGLLSEKVNVTFNEQKIEKLNKTLRKQIDKSIDDARQELENAKDEIEVGKAELESGKAELESGKQTLNNETSAAEGELNKQQTELYKTRLELTLQLKELNVQLTEIEKTEGQLTTLNNTLMQLTESKKTAQTDLETLEGIQKSLLEYAGQQAAFEADIAKIRLNTTLDEKQKEQKIQEIQTSQAYVDMQAGIAACNAQLAARELNELTLGSEILRLKATIEGIDAGLNAVDTMLAEFDMSTQMLADSLKELQDGKKQLQDGITALEDALKQLDDGQLMLNEAYVELEKQKTAAVLQMSDATARLMAGEIQLSQAQTQIEEGLTAVEEGRRTAYDSTDVNAILTLDTVASLLMAQNFSMPAGYVSDGGVQTLVSVGDAVKSVKELNDLVLLDLNIDGVKPIRLSDVADVKKIDNRDEIYARIDGNDGVLLTFTKQSTYATAEVSENLYKRFEELGEEYKGLQFTTLMDQGDYIFMMVDSILQNLFLSALFAVLILYLFLKDLKPTLITLCSIPLSVLFAIVLMYFSGVTLNMISMSALAVSIGMLVDNSVVVLENTYRLRNKGVDPLRAAVAGAGQVAGAIAASTLTTICVFLPIVFVQGLTRQLFMDMALTLGYSLGASLLVSLTLVPSMSASLLKNAAEKPHAFFDTCTRVYRRLLDTSLRHKAPVLIVTVVLLAASTTLALMRGFVFMPTMNSTQLTVSVSTAEDSTREHTEQVTDQAAAIIGQIEGVQTVGAMLSSDTTTGAVSSTSATMYVILDEAYLKKSHQIAAQINEACAGLEGDVSASSSGLDSMMGMLGGSGVSVNVYSDDMDLLRETVVDIAAAFETVEGLEEISDGLETADPEWHFTVDKAKAAKKGLTVAQVYTEIAAAMKNTVDATSISEDGKTYTVTVIDGDVITADELKDYTFTVTGRDGTEQKVKLADITTVEKTVSPDAINRLDQRRYLTVSAAVADGYNVTLLTTEAQKAVESLAIPRGVTVEFTGENETIMEAMGQLVLMLLLGVLFVYLVMVAQFQSLKSPFIVMFTIPLAFTGGFLALLITGFEVSVISVIGFVMLTGIIVNNGIVLVDYINQLRADGMEKHEALLEAGVTRMRPILMTSLTTILGLAMTAVGLGSGNEMMQPIAIVCIGGMIYATLMTLFVVPIIYDIFNRKELKVVRDEDLTDVEE